MDRLSVYIVETSIFGDPTPNKDRPAIFFNYDEGKAWLLGIYSEKDRFHKHPEQYYKILDKKAIPLIGESESFICVSKIVRLSLQEFQNVKKKSLNELSFKDSLNLINHFNAYHSQ